MKATAVFPETKQVRIIDAPQPELSNSNTIKIKMLDVGICGTDREIAGFEYGTPPEQSDYLILGHESVGRVVQAGKAVSNVNEDDLVVLMVRRPCGKPDCVACRSGRQDFCYTGDYFERGIKGLHGYMAEFVVDEQEYAILVPKELKDVAVLAEPLTIAEKALEQVFQIQKRLPWGIPNNTHEIRYQHKAVVVGAGPVGILGSMLLKAKGFEVFVYSKESGSDQRAELLKSVGASYTSAANTDLKTFAKTVGNIDLIYEATGAAKVSFDMLEQLGVNGIFIFTGVPGDGKPFEIEGMQTMRNMVLKNQVLLGTVNAPRKAYEDAVKSLGIFMRRWPEELKSVITSRVSMDNHVPQRLKEPPQGIKTVITVSE